MISLLYLQKSLITKLELFLSTLIIKAFVTEDFVVARLFSYDLHIPLEDQIAN
jgi:hypothetical protein